MTDRGNDLTGVLEEYYGRLAAHPAPDLRARVMSALDAQGNRSRNRAALQAASIAVVAAVALVLVGLATHFGPLAPAPAHTPGPVVASPSPSPSPSASPVAAGPTPLVLSRPVTPGAVHIVDLSGRVVATITIPGDPAVQVLVGPHHVVIPHDSTLTFYGASGAKLADDAFTPFNFSSPPLFTSDGSEWVWTTRLDPMAGPTAIYVGTQANQLRRVAVHADPAGQRLLPVRWVGGKVYLTDVAVVGGGRIQVPGDSGAWSLDPATGSLARVAPDSCNLQDVGADGTLLCVQAGRQAITLEHPDGSAGTLTVPGVWGAIGPAMYTPDGSHVVVSAIQDPNAANLITATFDGPAGGGVMTRVTGCLAAGMTDQPGPLVACANGTVMRRSPSGALQPLNLPAGDTFIALLRDPRD